MEKSSLIWQLLPNFSPLKFNHLQRTEESCGYLKLGKKEKGAKYESLMQPPGDDPKSHSRTAGMTEFHESTKIAPSVPSCQPPDCKDITTSMTEYVRITVSRERLPRQFWCSCPPEIGYLMPILALCSWVTESREGCEVAVCVGE